MKIRVKNCSNTVVFKSVDEIANSRIELDTVEFCLHKTVETELEQRAFKVLQEKIENQKYRLRLDGVQIVLVLDVENEKELKKHIEYIDAIVDEIRLDTGIERQIRHKACVLGNLINSELRVQMYS